MVFLLNCEKKLKNLKSGSNPDTRIFSTSESRHGLEAQDPWFTKISRVKRDYESTTININNKKWKIPYQFNNILSALAEGLIFAYGKNRLWYRKNIQILNIFLAYKRFGVYLNAPGSIFLICKVILKYEN
jgi:hypothetical protein